jgi:hypothetical protein
MICVANVTYHYVVGASLPGSDLYFKLLAYFIEHLKPLITVTSENAWY